MTDESTTTTSAPDPTTTTSEIGTSSTAPGTGTETTSQSLPENQPEEDFQVLEFGGLAVSARRSWEVRMRRSQEAEGETTRPVVHIASVPLADSRADYGGGVVETLGPNDVFISLVEFGSEAVNSSLFEPVDEFPSQIDSGRFHPKQLQRVIPGQAGQQLFFTYRNRPFCLYVVIGSAALAVELSEQASEMIRSIRVTDESSP